ncbi:MAG: LamG-like jellyroll fold domain-containing protein, partial [Anaerolineae bacterium]
MYQCSKLIRTLLFVILFTGLLLLNAQQQPATAEAEHSLTAESAAANLIAHWQFEEGSGTTVGDTSANSYDGTISGAAWSTQVNGATGSTRSLEFDGANDYIDSLDFDINNDFTVSAWINPDDMTNRAVISKHTSGGGNLLIVGFYGGYHVNLRNQGYASGTPQSGWQHIAVTGEEIDTGTHLTFYRDGLKLWEFNSEAKVGEFNGGKGWTIGQDWDSENRTDFFDGNIDDVRIYDGALTQAEVESLAADFATSCNVADEPALITAAANTSCDIIEMAAGTYDIANITPNHNVVIRGASEATTIIDVDTSGGSARAFGTSGTLSLTLQNMTIKTGHVLGGSKGGGVYNAPDAFLYLQDVTFDDNEANGSGGALASDGKIVAERVTFMNNIAPEGGAVSIGGDVQATFADSEFMGNSATIFGGAIYAVGGNIDLTISDTSFTSNFADAEGGALNFETSGNFVIANSTFTSNTTDGFGAAIMNNANSDLVVQNTKFESNSAVQSGGAIANWNNASLTIEDSYFLTNNANSARTSQGGGGAIRNNSGATATVFRSLFENNTVNDDGGAIAQMPTGGLITVSDSTFTGNEATVGGGVHSTGPIKLLFNTFHNNLSTNSIGGTTLRIWGNTTTLQGNILSSAGQNCSFGGSSTIVVSLGHNMSSDDTCLEDETNGDQLESDPLLNALANN